MAWNRGGVVEHTSLLKKQGQKPSRVRIPPVPHILKLEAWMSGLNQQFTKLSSLYRLREFESHRLRRVVIARDAIKNPV